MADVVLVFVNPISGRGEGVGIAAAVAAALRADGQVVRVVTDVPARAAVDELPGAAVVVGGDGTVRAVAERMLAVLGHCPPLAVVPLGTANLMGKHLAVGWRGEHMPVRVAAAVKKRRVRWVDAARANGQLFLLMAGVGIDGKVVHELASVRQGPIDYTSYILPAAMALGRYDYPPITVTIDGRRRFGPRPGVAFVGNIAEYGTGFPLLPHARSDDGLLDVCALPCASRGETLGLLLRAAAGEHLHVEGALDATGRSIHIDAARPVPVQLDGDAAGHTPLTIELLAEKLPFIVG